MILYIFVIKPVCLKFNVVLSLIFVPMPPTLYERFCHFPNMAVLKTVNSSLFCITLLLWWLLEDQTTETLSLFFSISKPSLSSYLKIADCRSFSKGVLYFLSILSFFSVNAVTVSSAVYVCTFFSRCVFSLTSFYKGLNNAIAQAGVRLLTAL